jgi:hypothetical protein
LFLIGGILAVNAMATNVWGVWRESAFVANQRVLRVAPAGGMSPLERLALINQRLNVIQSNYPYFDPNNINIALVLPKREEKTNCPEYLEPPHIEKIMNYYGSGLMRYVVGYYRSKFHPPMPGEENVASFCTYVKDAKGLFRYEFNFIPIVTVTPEDAKLHRTDERSLAILWRDNLRKALSSIKRY